MAQTRTRGAAEGERSPEDQNLKRAVQDTPDFSPKPSPKRPRLGLSADENSFDNTAADNIDPENPIDFWTREGHWPRQYFEPDMGHQGIPAQRRPPAPGRKRSNSATSITPSDQKPREEKSAQYRDSRYRLLLNAKGCFMQPSVLGVTIESKALCKNLIEKEQTFPENSLFCDDLFDLTCLKLCFRNEPRVIQDISRLIVPSAESLATYGAKHLEMLIESVNEGWNHSVPLTGTRPQPDYSVGFRQEAFTEEQLEKLAPYIGDISAGDLSFFMATNYMYFPFLACEVKCGDAALDVADRQNAHSMAIAARAIVELFRLVKRENEVHRQILSFSVSHDHRSGRIYGYYPVIDGKKTKYYRHIINDVSFTAMGGKGRWVAYQFTKNVYDTWMPDHFRKICSAINQLPLKVYDVPAFSESAGPSQGLENPAALDANSGSLVVDEDHQTATPRTSFSKPGPAKRRKSPVKKT